MDDIHGKVALVSGASRGIGRAVAATLARAGADVAVNYFSSEKEALETLALVRETGQRGVLVQADVSRSSETAKMIQRVERELGQVQILVNNAGIAIRKSLYEITEQDWDRVLAVNLKSAFLITQAVFQGMRELQLGKDHQYLLRCSPDRWNYRPALCRVEGRTVGTFTLLCRSVDKGWHYGQYRCSSVNRNRYGPGDRGKTRPHPRWPLRES